MSKQIKFSNGTTNVENTVPYKYLSKWSTPFYNYNNSNTNENPIENMSIVIKLQKIEKARENLYK
jgi:hypothetical protein